MRDLGAAPWTDAQVTARVRARTGRILSRFEIRDVGGQLIAANLNGVMENRQGSQQVEIAIDQTVKGTARYSLLPVDELRRRALNLFVHAYHGVEMEPDRWAWLPMGVHVWMPPERSIWTNGTETWQVGLGDITTLLELWTPGASGYRVNAGTNLGSALRRLFDTVGLPEWVEVPDIDEPVTKTLWWAPRTPRTIQLWEDEISKVRSTAHSTTASATEKRRAQSRLVWLKRSLGKNKVTTGRTTGLQIASEMCEAVGFEPPAVSWSGTVVVRPTSDPGVAPAALTYATETDSLLMLPLSSKPDLSKFRNRIVVSPNKSTTETSLIEAVADLNTVMPSHPFAQRNLADGGKGFYIGDVITDDLATSQTALAARARRELLAALVGYEEIAFSSMLNPAHEPYDDCGMRVDGDPEYGTAQYFLSRRLAVDLFDGTMTHQHARTFPIPELFA